MIRIDEIYNNVFLAALQDQKKKTFIHWFDPFGSTDFNDLCTFPKIIPGSNYAPDQRILFWDQEPLYRDHLRQCLTSYDRVFHNGDRRIIVTSEYNSEDVRWVKDTYGLEPAYYFFHAWAALDWYRGYNHTFLMQPFKDRFPSFTFLCPNNIIGGQRKHRLELLSELVNHNLVYTNLISFPEYCPYENKTVAELCQNYNINMSYVKLPLKIDSGANYHKNSHCIDMWDLSKQSLLHVVTETAYKGNKQHITEKTFKPIVMQQPFILVSCRGSLEYMRRYGFKTFSDFWDESYDEADDNIRISKIGKLLADLDSLSNHEKQQLQKNLSATVEHNYNWFYSQEFEQLLWGELQTMVNTWL